MCEQSHSTTERSQFCLRSAGHCHRRAFTLLEFLVASSLMAALMGGLWGLVNVFTSLSDRGSEELRQIGGSTQFFNQLHSDLKSVPRTQDYRGEPVLWGDASTLHFARIAPPHLEWLGQTEIEARGHMRSTAREEVSGPSASSAGTESSEPLPRTRFDADDAEMEKVRPAVRRIRYLHREAEDPERWNEPENDALRLFEVWRVDERSAADDGGQHREVRRRFPTFEAVRFRYFDGQRWTSTWDSGWRRDLPAAILAEVWLIDGDASARDSERSEVVDVGRPDLGIEQSDSSTSTTEENNTQLESAFALPEDSIVPDRPADLTRWIAL